MEKPDTLSTRIQSLLPNLTKVADPLSTLAKFSTAGGLGELADRFMALRQWLLSDLGDIEKSIDDLIEALDRGEPKPARNTAAHLLKRPGKRIRPMCVMLGSRIGSGVFDERVREVAIAGELIHAATLLHDDVVDEGTERRGDAAARLIYGNKASILGGDHLLVHALHMVAKAAPSHVLTELLSTMSAMVDSEALQFSRRGSMEPDRDIYLQILLGKTASLFCWCFRAGGHLAGMDDDDLNSLAEVGTNLGMSFQIVDDILDLDLDSQTIGKSSFTDVREGKITWPLILTFERDAEFPNLLKLFMEDGDSPELRNAMLDKIKSCGALEETRTLAVDYTQQATKALSRLPKGLPREAIEVVLELAVDRIL